MAHKTLETIKVKAGTKKPTEPKSLKTKAEQEKEKTLEDYEKEGYQGQDASLDISLYEYGLIWKQEKDDIKFIYGIGTGFPDGNYNKFDYGFVPINVNPKEEWNWANWDELADHESMFVDELLEMQLPDLVNALVSYYGYENVFGTSTGGFEIWPEGSEGKYEVIVSNEGTVYSGDDIEKATKVYNDYVEDSKLGVGRIGGEDVTLMEDGEPIEEYFGNQSENEEDEDAETDDGDWQEHDDIKASKKVTAKVTSIGFAIGVDSDAMIEENAKEDGIEVNEDFWKKVNEDISDIVMRVMKWMEEHFGGTARDEGYTNNNELVGTLFPTKNLDELEINEPLMTSAGTLNIPNLEDNLNYGTSAVGIYVDFFDAEDIDEDADLADILD